MRLIRTAALLVAAAIYVPLVIDWCAPGSGLHQATLALGGYGTGGNPFGKFFIWDWLVRLIGWRLGGLATLSMTGALASLALVVYIANRIIMRAVHNAHKLQVRTEEYAGVVVLSTALVAAAFIAVPGFLRAATRPGPLMVQLVFPLAGLALAVRLLTESDGKGLIEKVSDSPWSAVWSLILIVYGACSFLRFGRANIRMDAVPLLWFLVLGVLPLLALASLVRRRHLKHRRSQRWYLGVWAALIAVSLVVAVRSYDFGHDSNRMAGRIIANAEDCRAVVSDGVLDDLFLWMLPEKKRCILLARDRDQEYGRELAKWVKDEFKEEDLAFAAARGPRSLIDEWLRRNPEDFRRTVRTSAYYFPTVALWREACDDFVRMDGREPLKAYYRKLLGACGNALGCQLLEKGDAVGAWNLFWEILDRIDGENCATVINLCGLVGRGQTTEQMSRDKLARKCQQVFHRLKNPEQLIAAIGMGGRVYVDQKTRERLEARRRAAGERPLSPSENEFVATVAAAPKGRGAAELAQQAIHKGISGNLVRPDRIGQQLLGIDLYLGDWESAERDALEILRLDRHHVRATITMGTVCGRRGDYAEAEGYFRRVLKGGQGGVSVTNDLAFTLVRLGRAKEAVPLAQSAVRANPDNWNFRETLALALIRSGELGTGAQELNTAESLAKTAGVPPRAQIRLAVDRAWLYKGIGDTPKLEQSVQILRSQKGLDKGLLTEINAITSQDQ